MTSTAGVCGVNSTRSVVYQTIICTRLLAALGFGHGRGGAGRLRAQGGEGDGRGGEAGGEGSHRDACSG